MDLTASGRAAALWSGLILLVLLVLSGLVMRQRQRHEVLIGDGGVPELLRAQRAFANGVEYAAPGIAALAVLVVAGASAGIVHGIGACLFLGRLAHGIGLSLTGGRSIGRMAGMALTWTAWIAAVVTLILFGL